MPLELSQDCTFTGPALPDPFVRFELEKELIKAGLLSKTIGAEGTKLQESWDSYRRKLRDLAVMGGPIRVRNLVIEPLVMRLGYATLEQVADVQTREGREAGGYLLSSPDGQSKLRVWCTEAQADLDSPAKRGAAFRYSHVRVAQRVLLASKERLGLITNGVELRLLVSDPARPDSQIEIAIDTSWKRSRDVPDSFRLLLALASPKGQQILPDIIDKARLQQTRVTKELRVQSRTAIEGFIQEILDHPQNQSILSQYSDKAHLARTFWHEGLITVYRLLFILKLEASDDPARAFSFASSSLWRNSFSPTIALAPFVRNILDKGAETGRVLEDGMRAVFRMFAEGLQCTELVVKPLGGALFGENATPLLSKLLWGEQAVALLLDRLLWTTKKGSNARERVHYGPLDVEDLGRVYEALLELEPGIATESMCRLRRQKLEVVVPSAQGEKYRPAQAIAADELAEGDEDDADEGADEDDTPMNGKKTKVEWIEQISAGKFYLRVGLGRKSTGSYYTPHSFVRFLVQETLGPQVSERSPKEDPHPADILKLKVLDPAMGSGHFLVEACRFLGEKLYEACRLCDERALEAERRAESAKDGGERATQLVEAQLYRQRIVDLPDPDDEIIKYLPSHAPEGLESGLSQRKAEALCRRLIAVHCLYGVDKNVLAVELAKLSLWIESHAEGLPLTFLDHRLVVGDSLTGPFFHHLLTYPGSKQPIDDLFSQGLRERFTKALGNALQHVNDLEVSIGTTLAETEAKHAAKARLDHALAPFKVVAAAWAGGVMLGRENCDDEAYLYLVGAISKSGDIPENLSENAALLRMIARGLGANEASSNRSDLLLQLTTHNYGLALPYDLTFSDVFFPKGNQEQRQGFAAVIGNPPWDKIMPAAKEFFAQYDFDVVASSSKADRELAEERQKQNPGVQEHFHHYWENFEQVKRALAELYKWQNVDIEGEKSGAQPDLYRYFAERGVETIHKSGMVGWVLPSAFHANEGATGVRRLYLEQLSLQFCYSYENRKKLFEIHSSFKFAVLGAQSGTSTNSFPCAFYLHDENWLFDDHKERKPLTYTRDFISQTGGKYVSFLELRNDSELRLLSHCVASSHETCESLLRRIGISCGEELNKTRQSKRFKRVNSRINTWNELTQQRIPGLLIYEGHNIWQFDDRFEQPCEFYLPFEELAERGDIARLGQYYRFGYRLIASSTNERTLVAAIIPPGTACTQSISIERQVKAKRSDILALAALWNSFTMDSLARQRVAATVNKFLLETIPVANLDQRWSFLSHASLRLTCNNGGYEPFWQDQLGGEWREVKQPFWWPVLATQDERWQIRAAIDAVVADAYGLDREQYAYVLSTFSHKGYPQAPALCLALFDELQSIGLDTFTKKYDPYWDIPLNENLPKPVIDLPIPEPSGKLGTQQTSLFFEADTK